MDGGRRAAPSPGSCTSSTPASLLMSMHQDPHDRRLGPDQFVVSLRHYKPAEGELSRERLKAALSTAEGLLLQPRGEGELIELSGRGRGDAAYGCRRPPGALSSSHTGCAFKRNV